MSLDTKRILLVVGGGIAAYKVLELIRRLKDEGAAVRAVMSRSAHHFVTPLSVSAIAGEKVLSDLFAQEEHDIGHIRLSREADMIVVAPATADLLAKMAHGLADDLASAVLLATDKPVLAAPAMNPRMWSNAATQRNVEQLAADGVNFVGPEVGEMAEANEAGLGRMAEPATILAAIRDQLATTSRGPLSGLRAVVTSGPTHEPIDPVRYIANRSSGRQGNAIAAALARAGADVTLVSGPVEVPLPAGVRTIPVTTAREMEAAVEAALPADVAVMAAAVADWRVDEQTQKMKKGSVATPALTLTENPDILAGLARHRQRPRLLIGFAAETQDVVANAEAKLKRKGCDWIVANDVSPATGIMGGTKNRVHLVTAAGTEDWPEMSKADVAARLTGRIGAHFHPDEDEPAAPIRLRPVR